MGRKSPEKHLDAKFTVGLTKSTKETLLEIAHLENKDPSEIVREALAVRLGLVPSESLMGLGEELLVVLRRLSGLLSRPLHEMVKEAVENRIEFWVEEVVQTRNKYQKFLDKLDNADSGSGTEV